MAIVIPQNEIFFEASRSSGPGGQHVQKTSSRIGLRFNIHLSQALNEEQKNLILTKLAGRINKLGELVLHVESHRSQYRNKIEAVELLHELINKAIKKPKARKKTKPSKGSVARRLNEKSQLSEKKRERRRDMGGN